MLTAMTLMLQAPLPGNNAFFHHSTRVAAYPKRQWLPPTAQAGPPDGSYKDPTGPPVQVSSRTHTPYRDATPNKGATRENTPSRGVSPAPTAAARGEIHVSLSIILL